VVSGVVSASGSGYAFTSTASNLSDRAIESFQGDLFVLMRNQPAGGDVLISGAAEQGVRLEVDVSGLIDGDGLGVLSYQWLANGQVITGATASTFVLAENEVGKRISVKVSYTDGGGTVESITSSETGLVRDVARGDAGDNTVFGVDNAKASVLEGGGGNDRLIGTDRSQKAKFTGNRSDYEVEFENGTVKVIDERDGSPEGTDILENLNLLQFADREEFLPMAAERVFLTGKETDDTVQVDQSTFYVGTRLSEIFVIDEEVSAMIMAGDGDKVVFQGSFTDYDFAQLGSQLQVSKDGFVNTVNVGGEVELEAGGQSVTVELLFQNGLPVMMLGGQVIGDGFDVAALLSPSTIGNIEIHSI